jgi:hypothetical protein
LITIVDGIADGVKEIPTITEDESDTSNYESNERLTTNTD